MGRYSIKINSGYQNLWRVWAGISLTLQEAEKDSEDKFDTFPQVVCTLRRLLLIFFFNGFHQLSVSDGCIVLYNGVNKNLFLIDDTYMADVIFELVDRWDIVFSPILFLLWVLLQGLRIYILKGVYSRIFFYPSIIISRGSEFLVFVKRKNFVSWKIIANLKNNKRFNLDLKI